MHLNYRCVFFGMKDPKEVVIEFNEFINKRDIDGLAQMMTEDHIIDIENAGEREYHSGKKKSIKAWKIFFQQFPDYLNHFNNFLVRDDIVLVIGQSTCSVSILDGPALWKVKVKGNKVQEWYVCEDTPGNRKKQDINY